MHAAPALGRWCVSGGGTYFHPSIRYSSVQSTVQYTREYTSLGDVEYSVTTVTLWLIYSKEAGYALHLLYLSHCTQSVPDTDADPCMFYGERPDSRRRTPAHLRGIHYVPILVDDISAYILELMKICQISTRSLCQRLKRGSISLIALFLRWCTLPVARLRSALAATTLHICLHYSGYYSLQTMVLLLWVLAYYISWYGGHGNVGGVYQRLIFWS